MIIGMIRVKNTVDSDKIENHLNAKLSQYDINLKNDILCVITDGASVMKKLGKSIKPIHLTCQAHALHLAITDIVYNKFPDDINYVKTKKEDSEINDYQAADV